MKLSDLGEVSRLCAERDALARALEKLASDEPAVLQCGPGTEIVFDLNAVPFGAYIKGHARQAMHNRILDIETRLADLGIEDLT